MRIHKRVYGVTLTEMMISLAVTAIIIAMVLPILKASRQGFISAEIQGTLKETDQSILTHISKNLSQCKRIFQRSDDIITRVPVVSVLTGSLLPIKNDNGTLSPTTVGFSANTVGDSLFFARFDLPLDLLCTSTSAVTAPQGFKEPLRLDTYRFDYYYLKKNGNNLYVGANSALDLWEFESIPYVDYGEIQMIQNFTKSTDTVGMLYALGYRVAWLPSASSASNAFYVLYSSGTTSHEAAPSAPHYILTSQNNSLLQGVLTGVAGTFKYAISPNTGASYSVVVPAFAQPLLDFPGGLEVQIVGNATARQVFMRLVLIGSGYKNETVLYQNTQLTSTRDIW